MKEPFITNLPKAIDQKYLDRMLAVEGYQQSTGHNFATGKAEVTPHRTSSTYHDFNSSFSEIRDVILNCLKEDFGHVYDPSQCEPFQLQKYEPGQFFKPHYDFFNVPGHETTTPNDRIATVILYVKSATEGGTTNFPEVGINIKADSGDLVYFTYEDEQIKLLTKHEGTPIEDGEKIIATLWIRKGAYS